MKNIIRYFLCIVFILAFTIPVHASGQKLANKMPKDFVDISEVAPTILLDIRYFTPHNFIGERITGYEAPKCLLTRKAADALASVQNELKKFSLSLKIYDCYRPQKAVDRFVEWAKDEKDVRMKNEFYPNVDKKNFFRDGYIDVRSGHSRGSAVDLAIVPLPAPKQAGYKPGQKLFACTLPVSKRFGDNTLDFGTGFDCFDPLSHLESKNVGQTQHINRLLLKSLMEKHGFVSRAEEWWHFKLNDEPYPKTFFDFVVK